MTKLKKKKSHMLQECHKMPHSFTYTLFFQRKKKLICNMNWARPFKHVSTYCNCDSINPTTSRASSHLVLFIAHGSSQYVIYTGYAHGSHLAALQPCVSLHKSLTRANTPIDPATTILRNVQHLRRFITFNSFTFKILMILNLVI